MPMEVPLDDLPAAEGMSIAGIAVIQMSGYSSILKMYPHGVESFLEAGNSSDF
jgi:hypothetical protein